MRRRDQRRIHHYHMVRTKKDLEGRLCPAHGIPATGCHGMHYGGYMDPTSSWCFEDDCPAGICGGPHFKVLRRLDPRAINTEQLVMRAEEFKNYDIVYCPSCTSPVVGKNERCGHPFHLSDPSHNYGSIVSREGDGADAGGTADPLVQEPDK